MAGQRFPQLSFFSLCVRVCVFAVLVVGTTSYGVKVGLCLGRMDPIQEPLSNSDTMTGVL